MIDPPARQPNGAWDDPPAKQPELYAAPRDPDDCGIPPYSPPSRPPWLDLGMIMGLISLLISMGSTFWGWLPKTAAMEVQIQNQQLQINELKLKLQSLVEMKIIDAENRGKFEERLKILESDRKRQ